MIDFQLRNDICTTADRVDDSLLDAINPVNMDLAWQECMNSGRDPDWRYGGSPERQWISGTRTVLDGLRGRCDDTCDPLRKHMLDVVEDAELSLKIITAYRQPSVPFAERKRWGLCKFGPDTSTAMIEEAQGIARDLSHQLAPCALREDLSADEAAALWRTCLEVYRQSPVLRDFAEHARPSTDNSATDIVTALGKSLAQWSPIVAANVGPVRARVVKSRKSIELNSAMRFCSSELPCLVFHETTHFLYDALCSVFPSTLSPIQYWGPLSTMEGVALIGESAGTHSDMDRFPYRQGRLFRQLQMAARYVANYMRFFDRVGLFDIYQYLHHELRIPDPVATSIARRVDRLSNKDSQYFIGFTRLSRRLQAEKLSPGSLLGILAREGFLYP